MPFSNFKNKSIQWSSISGCQRQAAVFQLVLSYLHCQYQWPKKILVELTLYHNKVKPGENKQFKKRKITSDFFQTKHKYFLTLTWMCQTHEKCGVNSLFFPHRSQRACTRVLCPKKQQQVLQGQQQIHFIMQNNRPVGVPQNCSPIPCNPENWPTNC